MILTRVVFSVAGAITVLFSGMTLVANESKTVYEIPSDSDVLVTYGKATRSKLPTKFNILSWNIEKANFRDRWVEDFSKLAPVYDLVAIQEFETNQYIINEVLRLDKYQWNYFISWFKPKENVSSGIATGSLVKPVSVDFLRSPDVEPVAKTPKMASLEVYPIDSPKNVRLLVVNIHAINFVSLNLFERQIRQITEKIKMHSGPAIFIGDMNTWNNSRLNLLKQLTSDVGMTHYDFKRENSDPSKYSKLDHIFIRGLKVHNIGQIADVVTSDHYPIFAELEYLEN